MRTRVDPVGMSDAKRYRQKYSNREKRRRTRSRDSDSDRDRRQVGTAQEAKAHVTANNRADAGMNKVDEGSPSTVVR